MDEFELKAEGAPVVFTTMKPRPHNPLRRPKISYRKPVIAAAVYLVLSAAVITLCLLLSGDTLLWLWLWLGISAVYFAVIAKRTVIWLVHLYQNKASDRTRLKCVFEPSCSEYMILAVTKYGVVRGVFKGVKRLLRCRPPNGGVDYP